MPALRGQGNADDPATQYTVTHGHTPGPWKFHRHELPTPYFGDIEGRYPTPLGQMQQIRTIALITPNAGEDESDANAALIAAAPWHALLLRAVLKGWTIEDDFDENGSPIKMLCNFDMIGPDVGWDIPNLDASGLPACPDAETYERIRKAVDGA